MGMFDTPAFKHLPRIKAVNKALIAFIQAGASMKQAEEAFRKFNEAAPNVANIVKSNPRFKFKLLLKKMKESRNEQQNI